MQTLFLFVLLCPLCARALNRWYERPVGLQPGFVAIDTMPMATRQASAHVRLKPQGNNGGTWTLVWNRADSATFASATVSMPGKSHNDVYGEYADVAIRQIKDGEEIFSEQVRIECSPAQFFSLKLIYDGVSARLYGGDSKQQLLCQVPFSPDGGIVGVEIGSPMLCQRITSQHKANEAHQQSRFADMASLDSYLSASTDPIEGYWEYLDRDISEKLANFGGKYRIAVASDGSGSYEIIYIGGADINASAWQPMELKGMLTPTIFSGNYDLLWLDADGLLLDDDNNASLSDDTAILTLRFPLYKSQLRFRRAGPQSPKGGADIKAEG